MGGEAGEGEGGGVVVAKKLRGLENLKNENSNGTLNYEHAIEVTNYKSTSQLLRKLHSNKSLY